MNDKHSDIRTCIDRQRGAEQERRQGLSYRTEGARHTCVINPPPCFSRARNALSRREQKRRTRIASGSSAPNSYLIGERQQQRQRQRGRHERCTEYAAPRGNLHHNSSTGPSCARRVHVVYSSGYACTTSRACTTRTSSTRRHSPRAQEPLPSASMRIAWRSGCRQSGADA